MFQNTAFIASYFISISCTSVKVTGPLEDGNKPSGALLPILSHLLIPNIPVPVMNKGSSLRDKFIIFSPRGWQEDTSVLRCQMGSVSVQF